MLPPATDSRCFLGQISSRLWDRDRAICRRGMMSSALQQGAGAALVHVSKVLLAPQVKVALHEKCKEG